MLNRLNGRGLQNGNGLKSHSNNRLINLNNYRKSIEYLIKNVEISTKYSVDINTL